MTVTLASLSPPAGAALGFLVGLALGLAHFRSLESVALLYLGSGTALRAIGLQLARLTLLAATLTGLALAGAVPLLSGAAGLLAGRSLVFRYARRRA